MTIHLFQNTGKLFKPKCIWYRGRGWRRWWRLTVGHFHSPIWRRTNTVSCKVRTTPYINIFMNYNVTSNISAYSKCVLFSFKCMPSFWYWWKFIRIIAKWLCSFVSKSFIRVYIVIIITTGPTVFFCLTVFTWSARNVQQLHRFKDKLLWEVAKLKSDLCNLCIFCLT